MTGLTRANVRDARSVSAGMMRGRPSGRRMSCWWIRHSMSATRQPYSAPAPEGSTPARMSSRSSGCGPQRRFVEPVDLSACGQHRGDEPHPGLPEVRDGVCDDVADIPAVAQGGCLPLLRTQAVEQFGELLAFLAGQGADAEQMVLHRPPARKPNSFNETNRVATSRHIRSDSADHGGTAESAVIWLSDRRGYRVVPSGRCRSRSARSRLRRRPRTG